MSAQGKPRNKTGMHNSIESVLLAALISEDLRPTSVEIEQQAIAELSEAVRGYQHELPPEVSRLRGELQSLQGALEVVQKELEDLSPQAIKAFCSALNAPKGDAIKDALDAAQTASTHAAGMANKPANAARNILAYQVARVMRDILGVAPAATRDITDVSTGARSGAAYGRLLREVLIASGDSPPDDLYPLIVRGLRLLADPYGNNHSGEV
jgi:hypothetical protein